MTTSAVPAARHDRVHPGRWSAAGARQYVDRYGSRVGEDLALRVYTCRLIGQDPSLVLHGGGNTSVKGRVRRLVGPPMEVIYVKGSGWDLAAIEPEGLPALDLEYLRRLRELDDLSDEEMVNELRTHLLDASAPTPSVETLLHAFLPHRFVDHSHADAIISLTNQPDGARHVREALGPRVAILPYVMSGFRLSKAAMDAVEAADSAVGLVLLKHGLLTFGATARESYERHVVLVEAAGRYLAGHARPRPRVAVEPAPDAVAACALPVVRGALALPSGNPDRPWRRFVLDLRRDPDLLQLIDGDRGARLAGLPPLTPDHTIRTKARMLHLPDPRLDDATALAEQVRAACAAYAEDYRRYVDRGAARRPDIRRLDPMPRVVLVPGVGVVGVGESKAKAAVAADIAEHTLRVKDLGERLGRYEGLGEDDLFDMEYWSLQQAKLGNGANAVLSDQVALVTGAAGAIGLGVVDRLLAAGAHVAATDLDAGRLGEAVDRLRERHPAGQLEPVVMDVTDEDSVREGFDACCRAFGGVDLVVPNAGLAAVSPLAETSLADFEALHAVNTRGCFLTLREAVRVLRAQGTGGAIVIVSSKNVFGPGAAFGAYSSSKAAAHQLGRVAAMELGREGIRVNMINADAVFGDARTPSRLWETIGLDRAASRGLSLEELRDFYRRRTLLGSEIRPQHVGDAVVFFAACATPTTGAALPVDGGVPEAFPR